ncbi:type IV secretion system DNA-binding domain-containing protein [Xenorhabdus bovienii]|uniref:type IV secretion system DNA-binding domain-containing protein n=1 Tax=Xenorhabdus bovienii TaxID=40576 RepID=UPI003DA51EC5
MLDRKKNDGSLVELTRGGQTLTHFLRMFHQILSRYIKIVLLAYVIGSVGIGYLLSSETDLKMGSQYAISAFRVEYLLDKNVKTQLILPSGKSVTVTHGQIVNSSKMRNHFDIIKGKIYLGAIASLFLSALVAVFLFRFLRKRGKNDAKDEHIRGASIGNKEELISAVKEKLKTAHLPSRYSLNSIPLLPAQECTSILLAGSPGVGKSTVIRDILRQGRTLNDKAVIYDISGEFTKRFYRKDVDVILNPFDKRSHSWTLWNEGRNEIAYNRLAHAAIPPVDKGDPFWSMAPQLVFSSIMDELGNRSESPSHEHLMNIILRMSDDKLAQVVAHQDARTVFNLDVEKMAGSLRAVITTYTRNLKYLSHMTGPQFSFRDWARNEDDRRWVFLTVRDDLKVTMMSALTMWIESACSAILSLEPSDERRILCAFDEIPTLHPIPSLLDFSGTGRKFGAVPILGFQSNSQLLEKYGEHRTKTLTDAAGVFMGFSIKGSDGAGWVAKQLGNSEIEEATENISIGAADVRDTTNVNRTTKERELLLYSQIQSLEDLHCLIRMGNGLPVTKLEYKHDNMPTIAKAIDETDIFKAQLFQTEFFIEKEIDAKSVVEGVIKHAKANNINDLLSWEAHKAIKEKQEAAHKKNSTGNSSTTDSDSENKPFGTLSNKTEQAISKAVEEVDKKASPSISIDSFKFGDN